MEYSQQTADLIDRMCRYVEREDFKLDEKVAKEKILQTYDLFNLPRPKKVVWCKDIFDKKYVTALDSAGSAWSAGSAGSAGSARSAWSAGSAGSAGSAWSARSALDYDFDWFVIEHEYCANRKDNLGDEPNENDKKYLAYSELLLEALEAGLGYRVESEDTLYLVPTPVIRIDEQNRFHSTKEPAIRWKGGAEQYYLRGVRFDQDWWQKIVNDELDPETIFAIDNLEHRRIAYEYMDKTKMKQLKDFKVLDEQVDEKGNQMKIVSFTVKGVDESLKYYNCFCPSTGREYFVGTDKDKCIEAKAASFGLSDVGWVNEW